MPVDKKSNENKSQSGLSQSESQSLKIIMDQSRKKAEKDTKRKEFREV
ncbi:MAG: hypothetical protein K6L75_16080 [Cellvibrionaceae bacterium]